MPTFTHGSAAKLFWHLVDVTTFFKSATVDASKDTAETSAFGSTAKSYIGGLQDGTISAEGMFEATATSGEHAALSAALSAAEPIIVFLPEGDTVGKAGDAITGPQTAYTITSAVDDVNQVSADAQASHGVERVISLKAMGSQSAGTTNQASVDNAASSATGLAGFVVVPSVTAGNAVVKIQHSTDDSSWSDLITFTTATGATNQRSYVAGTVNRYLRATAAVTTGPATFHVCATRTPLSI